VLDIAYNIEYGAESSVQSSLNLIYLLGYQGQGQFRVFGKSNEKYHVNGGNDQVPWALANLLAGQISMGTELTAIKQNPGGSFTLTFRKDSGTLSVTADQVVYTSVLNGDAVEAERPSDPVRDRVEDRLRGPGLRQRGGDLE